MYNDIENYFKSEDLLEALLHDYKPKFQEVENYWNALQKGEISGYDPIDETLSKLSGLFMELNVIVAIADTELDKQEGIFNLQFTNEVPSDKKPVQSAIDRQVTKAAHPWRRIRNIFRSYRDSASTGKECSQSRLKIYMATRQREE